MKLRTTFKPRKIKMPKVSVPEPYDPFNSAAGDLLHQAVKSHPKFKSMRSKIKQAALGTADNLLGGFVPGKKGTMF